VPNFSGNYEHTIDQKSRLQLPAEFRADLGETFCAYIPLDHSAFIQLMTQEAFDEMVRDFVASAEGNREEQRDGKRTIFRNMEKVTQDKQGRITLSERFCRRARLESKARLVGVDDFIEICSPNLHDDDAVDERFAHSGF